VTACVRLIRLPALLCAGWLLAAAGAANAAELRWQGRPMQIVASEKRLTDFLRELAASQGTTAVIDGKVDGVISGKFVSNGRSDSSARAILDGVCASYGLTWYFDGSLLFIDLASDARSEVLPIVAASAPRINDTLNRLQIADRRFPLNISAADGTVFVSGPARYVESVKQIVKSIDYRAAQIDMAEVRVFPLKYSWAADFQLKRAGRDTTVAGVVSVLRSLFEPRSGSAGRVPGGGAGSNAGAMALPRITANREIKLPSGATVNAPKVEFPGAPGASQAAGDAAGGAARTDLPQFHSDPRLNAVLIRDLPERMAQYGQLIAAMDVKPRLVEIEVTIMDISTDTLDSLGVDWRLHGKHADVQTGNGQGRSLTWGNANTEPGLTGVTVPKGGVFTVSIGSELRDFLLARVSALASTGQAQFVARPKVLTLDNTEASIENKSEFYIRVSGFQDSSLYTVNAGTDVRVTPMVIEEASGRGVMMNINIGDDSVSSDMVENLPIVRRRSVVTQAMVDEGKSILLAGYSSEESVTAKTGVPGLSALPFVGALFRYDQKKRSNLERFYMLTPRFVLPGDGLRPGAVGAAPAQPAVQEAPVQPAAQQQQPPADRVFGGGGS
jgi:type III secretion protein C